MKLKLAIGLILAAALTRLLPHPYNFTPIGAMGLFGAAYFGRNWLTLAIPFAALFLSDLLLNNVVYAQYYSGFTFITSWWIYGAFALVMLIGLALLRSRVTPGRIVASSLLASVAFYLVSNFGAWIAPVGPALYPKTMAGLVEGYIAGLPFLGNTVLGDLFFCALLFGAYAWASRRELAVQKIN